MRIINKPQAKAGYPCDVPECVKVIFARWISVAYIEFIKVIVKYEETHS